MSIARVRLVLALLAFGGWLTWLAVAVADKDSVERVSRAQLIEARYLVVAEVDMADDGRPVPKIRVLKTLAESSLKPEQQIEVVNLPAAMLPSRDFPGKGVYFLPLVPDEVGMRFRIAGLPRSPGYERAAYPERPIIYPWDEKVQTQLRTIGYQP
jgi:hypothetical protein